MSLSGAPPALTTATPPTTTIIHPQSALLLKAATVGTQALTDICGTMFCLELQPQGEVECFDATARSFAGCVTLFHEGGSWEFALYGTEETAKSLARAVLAMEPDEDPEEIDVLDVLGEMVNMVAGSAKAELTKASSSEVNTTSPMFLTGEQCQKHQPKAMSVKSQAFTCDSIDGALYLVWQEVTPASLVSEIGALLETHIPGDKLGPTQMISYFQDIDEFLPNTASEHLRECIEDCESILTEVINDEIDGVAGINAIRQVNEAMQLVFHPAGAKLAPDEVPNPRGLVSSGAGISQVLQSIERDEDTVDMLSDFLEESGDGLEQVDGILLDSDGGGVDAETVNNLFRIYHSMKGASSFLELAEITSLSHTTETLLAKVRDGEAELAGVVLDLVFDSTALTRTLFVNLQSAVENGTEIPTAPNLSELIQRLEDCIAGKTVAPSARKEPGGTPDAAAPKPAGKTKLKQTLKLDVTLIEQLEAAIVELGEVAEQDGDLNALQEVAERLTTISAQIRMVSLGSVFQKMTRMVRDLSKKTEKLTKVNVDGEDTKVPRHVVEGLNDPLVHIMRNAVDHGIEEQDERAASGKPMLATVSLTAFHEDGQVVVEIAEDGRGMDASILIAKAIEKGVLEEGAEISEAEAYMLIFAPGFSTAAQVTAISGRGVGMDVVRKNIENLGGKVTVDSVLGKGSTFRLAMPLVQKKSE